VGVLTKSARWRDRGFWLGAAAAGPLLVRALVVSSYAHGWSALPAYLKARMNADALLLESFAIVIAAPLVGVAAANQRAQLQAGAAWLGGRCALLAAAFATSAAAVSLVFQPSVDIGAIIPPYLTMAVAALAMASVGAAAGEWLEHPLDAAACACVLCLAAGLGVLVAGPLVDGASAPAVSAGLFASPVVAVASAADIDLFRGEPLYRFSPIAHGQFEYPAWPTACVCYAAVAVACFACVVFMSSRERRTLSGERITV
jgi:hypothetical protein